MPNIKELSLEHIDSACSHSVASECSEACGDCDSNDGKDGGHQVDFTKSRINDLISSGLMQQGKNSQTLTNMAEKEKLAKSIGKVIKLTTVKGRDSEDKDVFKALKGKEEE